MTLFRLGWSRFLVTIDGEDCELLVDEKRTRVGFVTTRYVSGRDRESAASQALRQVQDELRRILVNELSDPPRVWVSAVRELERNYNGPRPRAGFTFYTGGKGQEQPERLHGEAEPPGSH